MCIRSAAGRNDRARLRPPQTSRVQGRGVRAVRACTAAPRSSQPQVASPPLDPSTTNGSTTRRSMRRGARSIRSASAAPSAASSGRCCSSRSASITSLPFLRWDRGPNAPDQAVLIDLPNSPLLFLLHRDLAAGGLLPHRPADHRRDGAVPDERGRRPRLVRLSLPADGVDRPVPDHRALVEGDRREHLQRDRRRLDRRAHRARSAPSISSG